MKRLHSFSRLLDSAIPLPGGYRIGFDGLIGLIPGVGDIAGGMAASYIIVEAARLGASTMTLVHMVFNVLLESLVGIIPVLGDLFDFAWKANLKNMALLEKQLDKPLPESSPEKRLKIVVALILLILFSGIILLTYLGFKVLSMLITGLHSGTG
ncbi:MAG: DUF4112 domain-containing protein [Desulfobulbaceae bacterium]|nr:DUF4112 domain-containing protein [Desulfobulbaceae bacterium]